MRKQPPAPAATPPSPFSSSRHPYIDPFSQTPFTPLWSLSDLTTPQPISLSTSLSPVPPTPTLPSSPLLSTNLAPPVATIKLPPATLPDLSTLTQTATLPDQLLDALRDNRYTQPLDFDNFLNNPRPPKLTKDDIEHFARKPLQDLIEAETHAFADQLEQYLALDSANPDLREEAHALHSLNQYMCWHTMAKWLKLYANPSSQF